MRIIAILMILTLSSCMVSTKVFDAKCAEFDSKILELESKANGMELKEQLLRQAISDLKTKSDTIVIPHDPANE